MVLLGHLFKDEMDEPSWFGYVELEKKMCLLGGHLMLITMDWYQGCFHPLLPSITHPQQICNFCKTGALADTQMIWLQSKPATSQGEMQVSSPGKNNQYRTPAQVRSGVAEHSPAGNGLPGDAWLDPSQQGTPHTLSTTHRPAQGAHSALLCSHLVRPYLGYSPALAQPVQIGCGETGTGLLEGCQTGFPENMA